MQNKRQSQVGELIRRNFSNVLLNQGRYIYQDALVSVTNVLMSSDLQHAKIYLSIYNNNKDKAAVLTAIENEKGRLKSELGTRLRKHIRRIPEIEFFLDETLDEMDRMNELFEKIRNKEDS